VSSIRQVIYARSRFLDAIASILGAAAYDFGTTALFALYTPARDSVQTSAHQPTLLALGFRGAG